MVLTIEIHLSQRFAFQEPDDRTKVQLISLKGPSVSLLFPLRTASLRGPIGSLQGHLHKHAKRMRTKCRTQTTGTCRLKTGRRVEGTLRQKNKPLQKYRGKDTGGGLFLGVVPARAGHFCHVV